MLNENRFYFLHDSHQTHHQSTSNLEFKFSTMHQFKHSIYITRNTNYPKLHSDLMCDFQTRDTSLYISFLFKCYLANTLLLFLFSVQNIAKKKSLVKMT